MLIALAVFAASCSDNKKYKDRFAEIKMTCHLPIDAVIIKELGMSFENGNDNSSLNDIWCVYVLGSDTILYHNSCDNNPVESMCKVSSGILHTTNAVADTTVQK